MAHTMCRDPDRWKAWIHPLGQEVGIKIINSIGMGNDYGSAILNHQT